MNEWNKDVLNEIEKMNLPQKVTTKDEQERLYSIIQSKIKGGKPMKRIHKPIKAMLFAAAILCTLTVTVAAASVIIKIGDGKSSGTGHFEGGEDEMLQSIKPELESYSGDVAVSKTDGDITVTLDSLAADRGIVNAFFTITTPQAMDLRSATDTFSGLEDGDPEWYAVSGAAPNFRCKIDGQDAVASKADTYMQDDKTMKLMVRIIPTHVLADTFTVSIKATNALHTNGKWEFSTDVDISAVKKGKTAAPQTLTFNTFEGEKKLEIGKLAVTPFGISLSALCRYTKTSNSIGPTKGYIPFSQVGITDDKDHLLIGGLDHTSGSSYDESYKAYEMFGGSLDTKTLTFTPIKFVNEGKSPEKHTLKVTDIGTKIQTSDIGGFIFSDYKIQGTEICFYLKPYGYVNNVSLFLDDDDVTTREGRFGLQHVRQDYKTGDVIFSVSYYAATPEELQKITEFSYYNEPFYSWDTDAAVTVTLE